MSATATSPPGRASADFLALAGLARYGVMLASEDGGVTYVSKSAGDALGITGPAALRAAWPAIMAQRGDGAAVAHATLEVEHPGGQRHVRAEVHPLDDGTANPAAAYLVLIESLATSAVSQLRLANQAVVNAYLASALLHEINAPLNNVKLTLALCDASLARSAPDALPADMRTRLERYFKVVGDETSRLALLLDELRQMSSAAPSPAETFDLRGVVADIARLMRHEATIRQIKLRVDGGEQVVSTHADRRSTLLALLGLVIHMLEQTGADGMVFVVLGRTPDAQACIDIESTAAREIPDTQVALANVADGVKRQDIPLVAARAHVEAVGGSVDAVTREDRFGFRVLLPLAPG
jgi:signal transduction histidine kinase